MMNTIWWMRPMNVAALNARPYRRRSLLPPASTFTKFTPYTHSQMTTNNLYLGGGKACGALLMNSWSSTLVGARRSFLAAESVAPPTSYIHYEGEKKEKPSKRESFCASKMTRRRAIRWIGRIKWEQLQLNISVTTF